MGSLPTLRIFFSSPGDVKLERETARRIVERLQAELGHRAKLEPYFWEHEVLLATRDYQQNIPPMDGFDVVVCILWSRLGSPLDPKRHPRPSGGYFESGTEYEFAMALEAHRAKGAPELLVFRNRTEPRRPSRPKEAREAVDREIDRLDDFFERYFREGQYYTGAVNSYRTLGEFEDKLTQGLRAFLEQHLPAAATQTGARARPAASYAGRPYLGLAAFDFADAGVFFGRTAQVGEVVAAFQAQELEARSADEEGRRFVLVLGASGSGKSSLARAGVLPMLVQPGVIEGASAWRRAHFRPGELGGDPFLALATALLEKAALPELGSDGSNAAALAGLLRRQPAGAGLLLRQALSQAGVQSRHAEEQRLQAELRELEADQREEDAQELKERLARLAPPAVRLALLCDQLEELFTADRAGESTAAFVECLASLAGSGRCFVLATLRSDFYPRCLEHRVLVELMRGSGSYALPAPGPAELGQMIRQPAAVAGLAFEEDAGSGEKLDETLRDAALRDPAALPLLGYALEQLYERRTSDGLLTLAAYRELGGLEGAIGRRAEAVFGALPAAAQAAFDGVWRQLVTLGESGMPVRRHALAGALEGGAGRAELVEALIGARLLTADRTDGGDRSISVAHEALLRHWPRVTQWIESNRDFLRARSRLAARLAEWNEHGKNDAYLIPAGPALGEAESILARHGDALATSESDYIRRSAAAARLREQARLRRARWVAAGAVVLSVLALIGGGFAWHERGVAQDQRLAAQKSELAAIDQGKKALEQEQLAVQQKEAAERNARAALASQTRTAYALGIEMLESGKSREGITSLAQALTLDPMHQGARDRLYSHHLYGLPRAICRLSAEAPAGLRQRISGAGIGPVQRCAFFDARGAPRVLDLATQRDVPGPWSEERDLFAAVLNSSSTHLLCARSPEDLRVWSVDQLTAGPRIASEMRWTCVELSEDGRWLAMGDSFGGVELWSATDGRRAHAWSQLGGIKAFDFDPSSGWVVSCGQDLVLFDLATMSERARLSDPDWDHVRVARSPSGDVIAVQQAWRRKDPAKQDRILFLSAADGRPWEGSRTLIPTGEIFDFTLSEDGTQLAAATFASAAVVYGRDREGRDKEFVHETYAAMVRFSPDSRLLATATSDGSVHIWDSMTQSLAFEPIHGDGRLEKLEISWDGRYLLTSTARHARLWDLSVGRALTLPLAHAGEVFAVRFAPDGRTLWTSSGESGLREWNVRTLEPKSALGLGPGGTQVELLACKIDDGGRLAAVQFEDGSVGLVDLEHRRPLGERWAPRSRPRAWSLRADAGMLAVATEEQVVFLDSNSGQPTGTPWEFGASVTELRLSPRGAFAACQSVDGGNVYLFELATRREVWLQDERVFQYGLEFSPDERWLAVRSMGHGSSQDFAVLLWDLQAPERPARRLPHGDRVSALCFSRDGRWLATGTRGQIAQVWSVESGQTASDPMFHPANVVREVLFAPDGRLLATACGDQTVRVFDWREARPVSQVLATGTDLKDWAFSPDGTLLGVISGDSGDETKGFARLFEVSPRGGEALDLVALTEAATALRVSAAGPPEACDPFDGWRRLREATPDLWFFQSPARRAISPAFEASSLRWIKDASIAVDQTGRAMPAVGIMRAAMSYWKQNSLNRRRSALAELDPESERFKAELAELGELEREVGALVELARRGSAGDASTQLWLSLQAEAAQQMSEARAHVERALALAPDDHEILNQASDVYYALSDWQAVQPVLERLRELEPDVEKHRVRLGFTCWRRGDRQRAAAEFSAVLDSVGTGPIDRGYMLVLLRRPKDALRQWSELAEAERAANGTVQIETSILCAVGQYLAGDAEASVKSLSALIAEYPLLAKVELLQGFGMVPDFEQALKAAVKLTLERHPELRPR
jgi:WD40 repeat protein